MLSRSSWPHCMVICCQQHLPAPEAWQRGPVAQEKVESTYSTLWERAICFCRQSMWEAPATLSPCLQFCCQFTEDFDLPIYYHVLQPYKS